MLNVTAIINELRKSGRRWHLPSWPSGGIFAHFLLSVPSHKPKCLQGKSLDKDTTSTTVRPRTRSSRRISGLDFLDREARVRSARVLRCCCHCTISRENDVYSLWRKHSSFVCFFVPIDPVTKSFDLPKRKKKKRKRNSNLTRVAGPFLLASGNLRA